jgi:holo-[acyl-carrier protein] synthase
MGRIIGIGTDIADVGRILKAVQKVSFLNKCYTDREQKLIEKRKRSAACNFAGKEAVVKAFGTGFTGILPSDIEILRNEKGAPYVNLYGKAKEVSDKLGIDKIHISLSDTKESAIAYVVAERCKE